MPSTTSSVVSIVFDSSTVMTPSLPTFFIASAMIEPICLSLLALIVPTCAIMSPFTSLWNFLISSTATATARSMPRLSAVGRDIRGLRRHFPHHLCAHVFKGIRQIDLFCYRYAVLRDDRRAEFLLD